MNPEYRLYWLLRRRLADPPSSVAASRSRRRINAVLRLWLGGIVIG